MSPRRRSARRTLRRWLVVGHRWAALTLGLALVVITTSGALLVYKPELQRAASGAYSHAGGPQRVAMADPFATVQRERPDFDAAAINAENGLYAVSNADYDRWVAVDWTTGQIVGEGRVNGPVFGFLENLHECFLTCEGEPGYIAALADPVPWVSGWPGLADVTWASVVLGGLGLVLGLLALSGLVLWWPATGRFLRAVTVRWRKGRFARDYDLHQVAGMIAVPLLLLWAVTGAGFELPFVAKAWFAVTPGSEPPDSTFASAELPKGQEKTPDISMAAAIAAAQRVAPGRTVVNASLPEADDPTSTYTVWVADGFDPYGKTAYPGDMSVGVDRHSGAAEVTYGGPGYPVTTELWENWSYPAHAGFIVNGWWRAIWFTLGMAPLLLMVTGISTWLVRRRSKRSRKAGRKVGRAAEREPVAVGT